MNVVRDLRRQAGLTQVQLAQAAGTSQPAIAAYEAGSKSPTLQTFFRIARAVGLEPVVSFVPALTREDRRSLALHRVIAQRLIDEPDEVLAQAQRNLAVMWERHPQARASLGEWRALLSGSLDDIVTTLCDPSLRARELRAVTPFAGVLTAEERANVYRSFANGEVAA